MGLIQDKPKVVLGAAFVLAAGLAVGAGIVFANAGDDTTSRATSPLVTPAPTSTASVPTPEPSVEVTATAEPTPTATATASASATATASASATPSATGSPGTTYAYPKPSRQYDGLALRATLDPGNGTTDTVFHLTIKGSDGDGTVRFTGLTYGDNTREPAQADPTRCKSYPPLTSPPGAYQPEPSARTYAFTHRYARPGRYTLTMHLASVNADCKPHGPVAETRDAAFTVIVTVPAPVPSPTPSPSETANP
jgi:hypothetical protein